MALTKDDIINALPVYSLEEGRHQLDVHAFVADLDLHDKAMSVGFLGSLRPYRGVLYEKNFQSVMGCIKALGPGWGTEERKQVGRDEMRNLWSICHLGRAWGVEPWGMLQSNNLIDEVDIKKLESWIGCISYATFCFLDGTDQEVALEPYAYLVLDQRDSTADDS